MDMPICTDSVSDNMDLHAVIPDIQDNDTIDLVSDTKDDTKADTKDDTKVYKVSEEDINILKRQIAIDDETATKLLVKYNGDFVSVIMDFYNSNYKPLPNMGLATPLKNMLNVDDTLSKNNKMNIDIKEENTSITEDCDKYHIITNILDASEDFRNKYKTAYTYMLAPLNIGHNSITKFKKYGILPDIIKESVVDIISKPVVDAESMDMKKIRRWRKCMGTLKTIISSKKTDLNLIELNVIYNYLRVETLLANMYASYLNIYPLLGVEEVLDKWGMEQAGLIIYKKQIKNKDTYAKQYPVYQHLINNNATSLARSGKIISNDEVIIGHAIIINPCY